MHCARTVWMVCLVVGLCACSKEAPAPTPPSSPAVQPPASAAAVDGPASLEDGLRGAAEIEAKRPALRKIEGKLVMGETTGEFEAFYEGTVLRHLEEDASHGGAKTEREYYLDSTGVLFYYHAEEERAVAGSGKEEIAIRIVFDPAGNVRASEKTLNGQPVQLLDTDVKGALARLGALREAAEAAAPPK